jgi:alkyl hydroperoxide reductase subunit AhpC
MSVRIGKPAPEFETSAYANGEIKKLKLKDFRGKWVLLYFYPGDFTFV